MHGRRLRLVATLAVLTVASLAVVASLPSVGVLRPTRTSAKMEPVASPLSDGGQITRAGDLSGALKLKEPKKPKEPTPVDPTPAPEPPAPTPDPPAPEPELPPVSEPPAPEPELPPVVVPDPDPLPEPPAPEPELPPAPAPDPAVALVGDVTPAGGIIASEDGDIRLTFPEGAFDSTTTVTVKRLSAEGETSGILRLAGVYSIEPSGPLGAPATLAVRYKIAVTHFQVAGKLLAASSLMVKDETSGEWLQGATDTTLTAEGYVQGTVTHFSTWTVGSDQPHGTSPEKTTYCTGVCHELSVATNSEIRMDARDKDVCYFCHGAEFSYQAASYEVPEGDPTGVNIQAAMFDCPGDQGSGLPAGASLHRTRDIDDTVGLWCTSCHNPHKNPVTSPNLLRSYDAVTGAAVTANGEAFCWTCHGTTRNRRINLLTPNYWASAGGDKKTGYAGSAHYGRAATSTAGGSCTGCHTGHGAPEPSLLAASEEKTCFACHTANPTVPTDSAPDVMSPVKRDEGDGQAGHPIGDPLLAGRHSTDETAADHVWANRHVECGDCHNSHTAKRGAHVLGTNEAAPALDGVWGVRVTNGAAGATPTYTRIEDVTYEYELCFKCHSAYVPGYTDLIGGKRAEDMSVTFNPANPSAHPIEGPGKNFGIKDSAFTLGTPWNPTDGDDPDYGADLANLDSVPKMTCSDCHSSNVLSEARGPHGSTLDNLLAKTASATHLGPYTGLYYGENDLCYTCHAASVYGRNASAVGRTYSRLSHPHFTAKTHCLGCHDPHGSSREHMLYPAISLNHTAIGGRLNLQNVPVVSGVACNWTGCHAGWVDYTSNY